ncbi:hypothetical protein V3331_00620 [Gaopeijia maritima]|uniref:hypothetical protein n=1 Tax=Gaopeijia maritima TaxID=3119007 RepID=UPI00325004B9
MTSTSVVTRLAPSLLAVWMLAAPASAQESISLRFAWPVENGRVTMRSSTVIEAQGMSNETSAEMSYAIEVEETADGLVLRYADYDFGDGTGVAMPFGDAADPELAERLTQLIQSANADIVVSHEGSFAGLAPDNSLDRMMATVDSINGEIMGALDTPQMQEMRSRLSDSATWEQQARIAWESLVEQWRGDWVVGEPRRRGTIYPLPFETEPVEIENELMVESLEGCRGAEGRCAAVVARTVSTRAAEQAMRSAIESMVESAGGGMSVEIVDLTLDVETYTLLHIETMRPIAQESIITMSQVVAMMGTEVASSTVQTIDLSWDWGN